MRLTIIVGDFVLYSGFALVQGVLKVGIDDFFLNIFFNYFLKNKCRYVG